MIRLKLLTKGSHFKKISLNLNAHMSHIDFSCQATSRTQSLSQSLKAIVSNLTLIQIDRFQLTSRITLHLDHCRNGLSTFISKRVSFKTQH